MLTVIQFSKYRFSRYSWKIQAQTVKSLAVISRQARDSSFAFQIIPSNTMHFAIGIYTYCAVRIFVIKRGKLRSKTHNIRPINSHQILTNQISPNSHQILTLPIMQARTEISAITKSFPQVFPQAYPKQPINLQVSDATRAAIKHQNHTMRPESPIRPSQYPHTCHRSQPPINTPSRAC